MVSVFSRGERGMQQWRLSLDARWGQPPARARDPP